MFCSRLFQLCYQYYHCVNCCLQVNAVYWCQWSCYTCCKLAWHEWGGKSGLQKPWFPGPWDCAKNGQKMDVKGPNKTRQGPQITLNSEYKTCLGLKIVGYRSIINLIKPKIIICLPLLLMWTSALYIRFNGNPDLVIRFIQFHYCTVSNPGTGADDAFVLKRGM